MTLSMEEILKKFSAEAIEKICALKGEVKHCQAVAMGAEARAEKLQKELAECKELSQFRYEYIGRLQRSEWKLEEEVKRLREALDLAWGLIANASGSDWKKESLEWQEAAARWRDNYYLLSSPSNLSKVGEAKEKVIETAKKLSQGNSIWDSWDDVDEALKELDIAEKEIKEAGE